MPRAPKTKHIVAPLLAWWDKKRRAMPWRAVKGKAANPYYVLVSEFMLQQTTVAAVTPYFQHFIKKWPDFKALSRAGLEEVRAAWAGLGYYRRAAFLHACAKAVVEKHGGALPKNEEDLRALPGIGPYTAAAIAAIAFGKKANVVDGNVERVMARLFAIGAPLSKAKQTLRAKAETLLPDKRCGDYAQALMDLGATICTPKNPRCSMCPLRKNCAAFAKGMPEKFPGKAKSKKTPIKAAVFFVLVRGSRVLLRRRPEGGLYGGLWEFPSTPWEKGMAGATEEKKHAPEHLSWKEAGELTHVFSHFTLKAALRLGHSKGTIRRQNGEYRWHEWRALAHTAMPSLMHKLARKAKEALLEDA